MVLWMFSADQSGHPPPACGCRRRRSSPGRRYWRRGCPPDGRLLTLQRSQQHLEFVSRDSPNMFLQVGTGVLLLTCA